MSEYSKALKATRISSSLKITIPSGVAKHLEIEPGDLLEWKIIEHSGKLVALVMKSENGGKR